MLSGSTLYGTTNIGSNGKGNVFSISTNGSGFQNLHSFNGSNGEFPDGSLILSESVLYGTTSGAGQSDGNIFSIHTDGSGYEDLLDFDGANGTSPAGDLILGSSTLYGMTCYGGSGGGSLGDGTVFALTVPTPEPSTLALLGVAALGLPGYAWRRRKQSGYRSHAA
jgi:hypothetical protein